GAAPQFNKGVNRAVDGANAKIAVHICFGNLYGRPFAAVRDFRNVYPALHDLSASQIVLEYANSGLDDVRLWQEFTTDKELGAGCRARGPVLPGRPSGSCRSMPRAR